MKKTDFAMALQAIQEALEKHYSRKTLVLNGAAWKQEALHDALAQQIARMKETDAAKLRWLQAAAAQREGQKDVERLVEAIKGLVGSMYGETSEAFAEFGFKPRRKYARSVESKAAAVIKMRATRAAVDEALAKIAN